MSCYFNISYEIKDKSIEFDENRNVRRAEFVVRAYMQYVFSTFFTGFCGPTPKLEIQYHVHLSHLYYCFILSLFSRGGRFSDGWGSCELREKRFLKPNHDIPSTAETRAKNKACQVCAVCNMTCSFHRLIQAGSLSFSQHKDCKNVATVSLFLLFFFYNIASYLTQIIFFDVLCLIFLSIINHLS